ncbi:MAG: hypothetical protein IPK82_28465 [Polyangiaceae bacterium]|nr:hypothetical protein [Polyangiaceae bacterium]
MSLRPGHAGSIGSIGADRRVVRATEYVHNWNAGTGRRARFWSGAAHAVAYAFATGRRFFGGNGCTIGAAFKGNFAILSTTHSLR